MPTIFPTISYNYVPSSFFLYVQMEHAWRKLALCTSQKLWLFEIALLQVHACHMKLISYYRVLLIPWSFVMASSYVSPLHIFAMFLIGKQQKLPWQIHTF